MLKIIGKTSSPDARSQSVLVHYEPHSRTVFSTRGFFRMDFPHLLIEIFFFEIGGGGYRFSNRTAAYLSSEKLKKSSIIHLWKVSCLDHCMDRVIFDDLNVLIASAIENFWTTNHFTRAFTPSVCLRRLRHPNCIPGSNLGSKFQIQRKTIRKPKSIFKKLVKPQ